MSSIHNTELQCGEVSEQRANGARCVCVCFSGILLSESRSVFLEGNGRMDRASWVGGVRQGLILGPCSGPVSRRASLLLKIVRHHFNSN